MSPPNQIIKPASLLVAAPNWLGDLVMFTPLLDMLKQPYGPGPGRKLTVAVRTEWMELLEGDPRIDTLLPYERGGRHHGTPGMLRMAADWRRCGFDAAILLPPSLRFAAAAFLAGIPRRIGFKGDMRAPLLTTAVSRPRRGTAHYSEELVLLSDAWSNAGVPPRLGSPDIPKPSLPACGRFAPHPHLGTGTVAWVLAVGSTYGSAKEWPLEHVAEFARHAVENEGVRVLVVGDEAAMGAAERLRGMIEVPWRGEIAGGPAVVDLVGRTSIPEIVSVLRGSALFVGNDSGLMHLAAALGTPTLGLFGSTSPVWTGPRGPRTGIAAATGFPCQPCYRRTCNQPTFCLKALSPGVVIAAARDITSPSRGVVG